MVFVGIRQFTVWAVDKTKKEQERESDTNVRNNRCNDGDLASLETGGNQRSPN